MTTQIQALPQLRVDFLVATNEDWIDSIAMLDAVGNPISLAGITFDMIVRQTASAAAIVLSASSAALIDGGPPSGTLTPGGTSGNVLGIVIPVPAVRRVSAFSGPCVFDAVARADGMVRRFMAGTVTFEQGVTR